MFKGIGGTWIFLYGILLSHCLDSCHAFNPFTYGITTPQYVINSRLLVSVSFMALMSFVTYIFTNKSESQEQSDGTQFYGNHHAAVLCGDVIYVFGGLPTIRMFACTPMIDLSFKNVWTYNARSSVWKKLDVAPQTEYPRNAFSFSAVAMRDGIYMYGGHHYANDSVHTHTGLSDELWKMTWVSENEIRWERVECEGSLPSARMLHFGWELNDKMWIFGGVIDESQFLLFMHGVVNIPLSSVDNSLYCFNPIAKNWTKIQCQNDHLISSKLCYKAAQVQNRVIIFARDASFNTSLNVLDLQTFSWSVLQGNHDFVFQLNPWFPCFFSFTAISDHHIVFHGGETLVGNHGHAASNTFMFNLNTLQWTRISGEKGIRHAHTATRYKDSIITIGGNNARFRNLLGFHHKNHATVHRHHFGVDSLFRLSLLKIQQHKGSLQSGIQTLPLKFHTMLNEMTEESVN